MIRRILASTQVMVFGLALLWLDPAHPAAAACAAPEVAVSPPSGLAGSGITVSGKYFSPDCNDTITCVQDQPCNTPAPARPQTDIEIVFKQGDRAWPLASVDAQPDLTFSISTMVPSEAQRGPAEVFAAPAQAVKFEVGGPPRVGIDKERLKNRSKIPPGQLRKIREQLAGKADPDDEDVWVSYLAAGLAIGLIAVGGLMLRRRSNN